ncbi:MAG: hypothetical protein SGILL_004461 [Bacillariaceae sp.]
MITLSFVLLLILALIVQESAGFLSLLEKPATKISCRIDRCQRRRPCALFVSEKSKSDSDESEGIESARQQLERLIGTADDENDSRRGSDSAASSFSLDDFLTACCSRLSPPDEEIFFSKENDGDDDEDDWEELDDSAKLMESLLPAPPPMSTMERARRLHEIQLLEQLEHSDEASNDLWELWYSERGLRKQEILGATDSLLANPDTWDKCDDELRELVEDAPSVIEDDDRRPGIYFCEAINRLATLYFLQGRMKDSYTLCRLVLHLKPWHFGALSGIVQVCIGMSNREEARYWAQRRLPTLAAGTSFPPFTESSSSGAARNPRRSEWCQQAIRDARRLLNKAERNTARSLGEPEEYYTRTKKRKQRPDSVINQQAEEPMDNQEDAWQ